MMAEFALTYLMVTFNKLESLRLLIPRLVEAVEPDDEILVIDGGSQDGTAEYLEELHRQQAIHRFISEPDYGESHAVNKGLLMARGELIKNVTDDDVFDYPTIKKCKRYMLDHPQFDLLATNGGNTDWALADPFTKPAYLEQYCNGITSGRPYLFSGLSMVWRRSSLPVLGLWHLGVVAADHELAWRVTSGPAKLAFYTGHSFVRIMNSKSNSVTKFQRVQDEVARLSAYYSPQSPPTIPDRVRRAVGRLVRPLRARLFSKRANSSFAHENDDWPDRVARCEGWLAEQNREPGIFLTPDDVANDSQAWTAALRHARKPLRT